MKKYIGSFFLKIWGWKIEGEVPKDDKLMMVVLHHTSFWDFFLGLFIRWTKGFDSAFVAKASLFKWPLGVLMRYLGGYPIERSSAKKKYSVVRQIEEIINKTEKIKFAFTPEGTRKKVDKLKTGFYTIAKDTNIKICLISFDFSKKIVTFDNPHIPAETLEEELLIMKEFYKDTKGYHPELSYEFK